MAEIRYLLDETIETELQNLKSFNGDGKERSAAIDDIVALYKNPYSQQAMQAVK